MKDIKSLSHTTWNCKYHLVFAPKYRRQVIYGKMKNDIGKILRKLCECKGAEIMEAIIRIPIRLIMGSSDEYVIIARY